MAAASFRITAQACPQLLCRVIGLFAQQGRVPERVSALRDGAMLSIELEIGDIDPHRAAIIAEKMRAIVTVAHVDASAG
ncbi:MAG: hypothetical protein WDN24_06510 [Sphingomonas sp.]